MLKTLEVMALCPVIPVLTIERVSDAVPLARALVAGGLTVLEITLRTPAAIGAIELIAREVEGAVTGAGTVLNPRDWDRAEAAGAQFIVSPGLTDPLIKVAAGSLLAFLPGVATAGELMRGLDAGLTGFKFFPAETSGGAASLKALYGPFAEVRFCPTGGITAKSAPDYLALPNVVCVGGGWVAPAEAVASGDFGRITELAGAASALKER
jgi:2-dehydro-3-deoxyphosphogluconate aldolase / (4S)-4-hydroxy-2-oxoglutarate aldolase